MSNYNLYAKYRCRYLRFLLDVFVATGHTPHTFSKMTDNPPSTASALRTQLNKDDMKASRAKEIVSVLGYQLTIDIKEKNPSSQSTPPYKLILPKSLQRNLERGYLPKKDRNKNLTFLHEFVSRCNISRRELSRRIGLSAGAIESWFRTDDIAISHLFKIEEAFDVEIVFALKPLKPGKDKK